VLAAVPCGRLRDAAAAERPVHPHALDTELDALLHRPLGAVGPRPDDDGVDAARDRGEVVVGLVAFDLVGVRVDREHVIAPLAQAPVDDVGAVVLRRP
jgi:hypothetical protein